MPSEFVDSGELHIKCNPVFAMALDADKDRHSSSGSASGSGHGSSGVGSDGLVTLQLDSYDGGPSLRGHHQQQKQQLPHLPLRGNFQGAGDPGGLEPPGFLSSSRAAYKSWNPCRRSFHLIVLLILLGIAALLFLVIALALSLSQSKWPCLTGP